MRRERQRMLMSWKAEGVSLCRLRKCGVYQAWAIVRSKIMERSQYDSEPEVTLRLQISKHHSMTVGLEAVVAGSNRAAGLWLTSGQLELVPRH